MPSDKATSTNALSAYLWQGRAVKRVYKFLKDSVSALVLTDLDKVRGRIAGLGLKRDEFKDIAATEGMWGFVRVSGCGLPLIQYQVFDNDLMEFIVVEMHLRKNGIHWATFITEAFPTVLKETPLKKAYKKPGFLLIHYLSQYFPIKEPKAEYDTGI